MGRKHDRSVLWVLEKVGDVFWTRVLRVLSDATFTAQEDLLHLLMAGRSVRRLCVDSTGIGGCWPSGCCQRWGHRVEPVHFSAPVKGELAMPLVRLFQDKLVRIPAAPEVREDLHKVRKVVTAAGNVRLEAPRDDAGHADRFWALALATHAADESKAKLPAPLRASRWGGEQTRMTKRGIKPVDAFPSFGFGSLGFDSSFGFRISSFPHGGV